MAAKQVTAALRATVRKELPELSEIADAKLRDTVVEAWATALAGSSFSAIGEIPPSGNPGTPDLTGRSQADHMRAVCRLAMRIGDELKAMFPQLPLNRDILVAGALCHDIGKPWEFDPANQKRWQSKRHVAGWPSIRHPPYGVHICLTAGLPEEVAHIACCHSGEGELVKRSLEATIVHHADYAFWESLEVGGLTTGG
jgi:putative nucleotidyltransferase with HDIG domain